MACTGGYNAPGLRVERGAITGLAMSLRTRQPEWPQAAYPTTARGGVARDGKASKAGGGEKTCPTQEWGRLSSPRPTASHWHHAHPSLAPTRVTGWGGGWRHRS